MEILIVAATSLEAEPLIIHLRSQWIESSPGIFTKGNCTVHVRITGIGMHRMAYALGQAFRESRPRLCINIGVAGAFPGKAAIGEVVHVTSEIIADLGAENAEGDFLDIGSLGLDEDISSTSGLQNQDAAQYSFIRQVRGITINTSHGSQRSIKDAIERWDPDVETMEGGAFFYCCLKAEVPFLEIRAISNIVEPRNKENWNIPLAADNLKAQILEILTFFVG
jgi:futalosine hydrolase